MRRRAEVEVRQVVCDECSRLFPSLGLVGDTDMATDGLCALTAADRQAVALAEMTVEEWNAGEAGFATIEKRVSEETGRRPWRVLKVRWPEGLYECIFCDGTKGRLGDVLTVDAFLKAGGEVVLVGDIELTR